MADTRKDCCKVPENLERKLTGRDDLELYVCRVCGCRHFEATAEPGVIGVRGALVG